MSKSKILLLGAFIVLAVVGIIGGLFLQQQKVSITTNTPIELLSGDRKIATVDTTKELNLRNGEYCTVAVNEMYSKEKECFMVYKQDKEVIVDASFSKDELSSKLDTEYTAIKNKITSQYASIINQYTVCRGELLGDGTWYGGILRDKVASLADDGNYYYYIMKKETGWNLEATPTVAISLHDPAVKDIPEKMVRYVNAMQTCDPELTDPANVPANPIDPFTADKPILVY